MSLEVNKRIGDWARWFHWHKDMVGRTPDIQKMEEFYTKAIDGLLEITAILARDIEMLEKRPSDNGFQGFYIPNGVQLNDKIRSD